MGLRVTGEDVADFKEGSRHADVKAVASKTVPTLEGLKTGEQTDAAIDKQ